MVETVTEEKVPLEAKNKPFMVCGFLGVFWNLSYGPEDHLGSTRMVLDEDGTIKEALMYQPYGTVSDVQGITIPGNDPLRQKFTTKEFDEEGDENGAPGIDAYHFGFRVYDPEIGVWMSTDPKDQFWNAYSYVGGNPIMLVDPNGEWGWVAGLIGGAAIGGSIGFVAGGLTGEGDWDWGRAWAGFGIGSVAGAAIGFGASEHFQNLMASGIFKSNAQIANSMNQASELFILEQRLAQVNSEITQLERCLANVGNPPPAVASIGDDESLIYFWRTVNQRGPMGVAPKYLDFTRYFFDAYTMTSNILQVLSNGQVIEKPMHKNPNVWRSDEEYRSGRDQLNQDLYQLQKGIEKVNPAGLDIPIGRNDSATRYFLNKLMEFFFKKASDKLKK